MCLQNFSCNSGSSCILCFSVFFHNLIIVVAGSKIFLPNCNLGPFIVIYYIALAIYVAMREIEQAGKVTLQFNM